MIRLHFDRPDGGLIRRTWLFLPLLVWHIFDS